MKRKNFIKTIFFSSAGILIKPFNMKADNTDVNALKIHMIYNNTGKSSELKNAWGLSVWIEHMDRAVLFDTGGKASVLRKNINNAGLDTGKINHIVISHNHWDHINGLKFILEETSYRPDVFIIESDYGEYTEKYQNARLCSITGPMEIDRNIWSTGELTHPENREGIREQSIILTNKNSMVLLTGCSHTGIVSMVATSKEIFPRKAIELVAGGFHLLRLPEIEVIKISNQLKSMGVRKIAPSHCTGNRAIKLFKREWQTNFIDLNLGESYDLHT